jgi:two-component system phosphate regulon sensor histidine kinase PhoR
MKALFSRLWKAKALWLRVIFCWILGMCFTYFDEIKDYDLRFRMRSVQETSKAIVAVSVEPEDWSHTGAPRSLKEPSAINDSYFWNAKAWNDLLGRILNQDPKSIGVTFFFSDQLPRPDDSFRFLSDPRVLWAGQVDRDGRPELPVMANSYGYNVALVDLREDPDRVLRRFSPGLAPLPQMSTKLAESALPTPDPSLVFVEPKPINFRGPGPAFPTVNASAVLKGRSPPNFFHNKIVVIGTHAISNELYQTPLGPMSRAEIIAQVVDNGLAHRWISRLAPWWVRAAYLLVVLLAAVWILTTFPQSVTFVFLMWLALGTTALSLWVFDTFYFWLPALSPLLMNLVTYMVLMGYQLSVKENQTWRLEQEKTLLSELDQLRNNFVSLISHDLKTPIAKIQAICDRLMAQSISDEVKDGLGSVRKESVELHRYIQSILQISRFESSHVQVRKEATDVNELVEKVVSQLRPIMDDKRQTLQEALEPIFSIEADSVMLQEVILNLIENAVKYTPNDGQIQVQTREVEDKVIFSVKDDGPGIPKEDQEHIFEKFFRGQAHKSHIKGTGLGLFLVKYFIELHGGEVFLESEVGKGTRVGFTLPLQA